MKTLQELLQEITTKSTQPTEPADAPLFPFSPTFGIDPSLLEQTKEPAATTKKQSQTISAKIPVSKSVPEAVSEPSPTTSVLPDTQGQESPQSILDANLLLKGFDAALEEQKRLRNKEIFLNALSGAVGLGAGINPAKLEGFELTDLEKKIANAPFERAKLQIEGALKETATKNALNKNDPNSELSKIYRDNFSQIAQKLGLTTLSDQLKKGKLSAQQVEDLTGELNLNNLFNTQIAADNRLQNLLLRLSAAEKTSEEKKESDLYKKEETMRKFVTNRSDLRDDRLNYSAAIELENSLRDIQESLQRGDKVNMQAQSVNALFRSMKLIQGDKSVIREGEYKNILGAFGTLENLERMVRQDLQKYGSITPNMMKSLNNLAKFYKKYNESKIYDKIKPDFQRVEDLKLNPQRIFDEDLQQIYQKGKIKEELLKSKKNIKFKDGKFIVEE